MITDIVLSMVYLKKRLNVPGHSGTIPYLIVTVRLKTLTFGSLLLPVDDPVLASIMTHDHDKDLCASELGPLRT